MKEADKGFDLMLQAFIHQAGVEIQSFLVDLAPAFRQDTRPGGGKAVGGDAKIRNQRDVFLIPVVVIDGHIPGLPALDLSGGVDEPIPDAFPLAILVPRAFHLVGGSRHTPLEPFRECQFIHDVFSSMFKILLPYQ